MRSARREQSSHCNGHEAPHRTLGGETSRSGKSVQTVVRKLLSRHVIAQDPSSDPAVLDRVCAFICGQRLPPMEPDSLEEILRPSGTVCAIDR